MDRFGIYKETSFLGGDEFGDHIFILDGGTLEKRASEIYAPVRDFIANELVKSPGKTYLHVNAMGAMEAYGQNVNGDAFPENELVISHTTFVKNAHPFYSHSNKDPKRALGKVVFSVYNPIMRRVELIVELDNEKAPDIVRAVEDGKFPRVSMGTRVPYEECSICHNKNKTLQARCEHLKYKLGIILPDGRRIMAINRNCNFFDISFVIVPADRTATTIAKVASEVAAEPHSVIFDVADDGASEGGPLLLSPPMRSLLSVLEEAEPDLPYSTLKAFSALPLGRLLATLGSMGVVLKPKEFQTVMIVRAGNPGFARRLYSSNLSFTPGHTPVHDGEIDSGWDIDPDIANSLGPILEARSAHMPYMAKRIALISNGEMPSNDPDRPLVMKDISSVLGGLYSGYRETLLEKIDKLIELLSSLHADGTIKPGASVIGRSNSSYLEKEATVPDYVKRGLISFPAAYLAAGYNLNKAKKGEPVGKAGQFLMKHPLLIGAAGTAGASNIIKGTGKTVKLFIGNSEAKKLIKKSQEQYNFVDSFLVKNGGEELFAKLLSYGEQEEYIINKVSGVVGGF